MSYWIENFVLSLVDTICAFGLFRIFGPAKETRKTWQKVALFLLLLTGIFYNAADIKMDLLQTFFLLVLVAGTMYFYHGFRFFRICVIALLFVVMQTITTMLAGELNVLMAGFLEESVSLLCSGLFMKAVLAGIIYCIYRIFEKELFVFSLTGEWVAFSLIPIGSLLFLEGIMRKFSMNGLTSNGRILTLLFIAIANLSAFSVLCDLMHRQMYLLREEIIKKDTEEKIKAYELLARQLEEQRKKSHEFQNYIHCLYVLLETEKYRELREYVTNLREGFGKREEILCTTGHVILDAIVNAKCREAASQNIQVCMQTDALDNFRMLDDDVVVLVSNLFNNALEAAGQCRENRYIRGEITQREQTFFLRLTNSYTNVLHPCGKGYQTTKTEQKDDHGYGLRNIYAIVEKYGGSCVISHNESEFKIQIAIDFYRKSERGFT